MPYNRKDIRWKISRPRLNIRSADELDSEYYFFIPLIFWTMNTKQIFMTVLITGTTVVYGVAQETGAINVDSAATANAAANADMNGSAMAENTVDSKTQEFADEAATGGMMEVALGNMAQEKANSSAVKEFALQMVTDHTQAGDELKALAQEKSIVLPGSMTDKQQRSVDKLSELSGDEFDKEYMKMMVKDHEKDVKTYEKASENVTDTELQDFAAKTLPTLKEHLQHAKDVNDQMRSS